MLRGVKKGASDVPAEQNGLDGATGPGVVHCARLMMLGERHTWRLNLVGESVVRCAGRSRGEFIESERSGALAVV